MICAALLMIGSDSDRELVESLYERYEQMMYNVAFSILHNRAEAEDAVQTSFVRIIDNLQNIFEKGCHNHAGYFVIIAKNVAINMLNKQKKHPMESIDEHYELSVDSYVETDFDVSGYRLSGGEKQRIGISRAFMGDKQVLVLHEPAAMLDPIAEYRQFQEIRGQITGQTAILISHRIGFARLADRILVMEAGRLVEDGTHEELMGRNGVYRQMFEAQKEWYDDVEGEVQGS